MCKHNKYKFYDMNICDMWENRFSHNNEPIGSARNNRINSDAILFLTTMKTITVFSANLHFTMRLSKKKEKNKDMEKL